ncbi:MAG: hypothetical protein LBQ89_08230 [Treponema sp.]|jgi:hypothetical protein|nr:hypothetical protein [Treponema sp.]
MALPNLTGTIIALGSNCHVRVGTNAADAENIALVASFQANEDFQVQDATCLGNLGPVSVDPQGYTCTVSLNGFLPSKRILDGEMQYPEGGKKAIMDYIPSRAQFMEAGAVPKIAYLDFYNRKAGKVLCAFEGVLITSNGVDAEGNAYVRNNVQMRALSWNKD